VARRKTHPFVGVRRDADGRLGPIVRSKRYGFPVEYQLWLDRAETQRSRWGLSLRIPFYWE